MVWLSISSVLSHWVWTKSSDSAVWQRLLYCLAVFVLVGGFITIPFNGLRALWGFLLIVVGLLILAEAIEYWWNWVKPFFPLIDSDCWRNFSWRAFIALLGLLVIGHLIVKGGYLAHHALLGTKAVKFVRRATSPPPTKPSPIIKSKLPKTILGKGVWVYCLDTVARRENGLQGIVRKAKWAGVDHLVVKTSDTKLSLLYPKTGDWMPYNENGEDVKPYFQKLVALAHAENIKVYAFGFVYGENPEREAELAIECLKLGADGYFYDVEDQFAGRASAAKILCSRVNEYAKKKPWLLIGFSSYDNPYLHDKLVPFNVFDHYCDVYAPQAYWKDDRYGKPDDRIGWAFNSWAKYQEEVLRPIGGGKSFDNIIPIGHGYDARLYPHLRNISYEEIIGFMKEVEGYWGVQLWVWDYMGPAQWQALRDGPGGLEEKTGRYLNKRKK